MSETTLLLVYLLALAGAFGFTLWSAWRGRRPVPGPGAVLDAGTSPWVLIGMGICFVLVSVPFFYRYGVRLGRVFRREPGMLLVLVFPLAGLVLVSVGVARYRRYRRQGRVRLFNPLPAVGETVAGVLEVPRDVAATEPVRVYLVLNRLPGVGLDPRMKARPAPGAVRWVGSATAAPERSQGWTRYPFVIAVPAGLPGSAAVASPYQYLLVFEGPGVGRRVDVVRIEGAGQASTDPDAGLPPVDPALREQVRSVLARRSGSERAVGIGVLLFFIAFPLLLWMAVHERERVWEHLPQSLVPLLVRGGVALCIFVTLALALARAVARDARAVRAVRRGLWAVLGVDAAVGLGLGLWMMQAPVRPTEMWLVDGVLGLFVWIGVLGLGKALYEFTIINS